MQQNSTDIREIVLDVLLEHQGFENFWFDLDEEVRDSIVCEIDEAIEEFVNEQ